MSIELCLTLSDMYLKILNTNADSWGKNSLTFLTHCFQWEASKKWHESSQLSTRAKKALSLNSDETMCPFNPTAHGGFT
jgi:hypothetical protein